ncbi:MAG: hypothetical protein SangKO_030170 [Sandaracinaceae bacterium]
MIRALTRGKARERLRLDGVITVIDASRVERALSFDLAVEQLGFADVVVMSHADRADEATLDATEARLVRHAPGAVMIRAGRDRTVPSLDALLEQREEVLRILPEAAGAHARDRRRLARRRRPARRGALRGLGRRGARRGRGRGFSA